MSVQIYALLNGTKGMLNCLEIKYDLFNHTRRIFVFSILSWHSDDEHNINPSLWKTRTPLHYIVNIISANDLATQGARASAAMVLTGSPAIFCPKHPTDKELKSLFPLPHHAPLSTSCPSIFIRKMTLHQYNGQSAAQLCTKPTEISCSQMYAWNTSSTELTHCGLVTP